MKRKLIILSLILIFILAFTSITYGLSVVDNTLTGSLSVTINAVKPNNGLSVSDPIVNIEKEGYHLSIANKYWCNDKDDRLSSSDTFTYGTYYLVFKVKLEGSSYTFSNDISVISKGDMSGVSFSLVDIEKNDNESIAIFKSSEFKISEDVAEEPKEQDDSKDKKEEKVKKEKPEKVNNPKIEYKVKTSTILIMLIVLILILAGLVYWLRTINLKKKRNRGRI